MSPLQNDSWLERHNFFCPITGPVRRVQNHTQGKPYDVSGYCKSTGTLQTCLHVYKFPASWVEFFQLCVFLSLPWCWVTLLHYMKFFPIPGPPRANVKTNHRDLTWKKAFLWSPHNQQGIAFMTLSGIRPQSSNCLHRCLISHTSSPIEINGTTTCAEVFAGRRSKWEMKPFT